MPYVFEMFYSEREAIETILSSFLQLLVSKNHMLGVQWFLDLGVLEDMDASHNPVANLSTFLTAPHFPLPRFSQLLPDSSDHANTRIIPVKPRHR